MIEEGISQKEVPIGNYVRCSIKGEILNVECAHYQPKTLQFK